MGSSEAGAAAGTLGRSVGDLRLRGVGLAVADVGDRDALPGVVLAKGSE